MTRPDAPGGSRRDLLLRRVLPALAIVAAVVLAVVLTRGGDDDGDTGAAPATPAATSTSEAPAAADPAGDEPAEEEPTEEEPTATEPPAPSTQLPAAPVVAREGVDGSARTVAVGPADFAAPAQWSDGASVRVVEARQQVSSGDGPGALAGQPQTVLRLELVNGSGAPLVLDAVVVQATYGDPAAQATPLYDRETVDFAGTLAPGQTATAVYSFAVPADRLDAVTVSVDVDGYRFPAVFSGAVPA